MEPCRSGLRWWTVPVLALALALAQAWPCENAFSQAKDPKAADLLASASKSFEAGAYTNAQMSLDEAFKLNLSNDLASRALLLRAQVNEKSGRLARALSDYSGAAWMQNLTATDQKTAVEGKARVIAAMGLSSPERQASNAALAAKPSATAEDAGSEKKPDGGVLGIFSGLFGSASPSASPEPTPEKQPSAIAWKAETSATPAPALAAKTKALTTAAATPEKAASPPKTARVAAVASPLAESPRAGAQASGFHIDFGGVAGVSAARAKAQEIKTQLAEILVNRELAIQQSGGTFHILAGPYKSQATALSVCSAIKQRGVPCQVTQ